MYARNGQGEISTFSLPESGASGNWGKSAACRSGSLKEKMAKAAMGGTGLATDVAIVGGILVHCKTRLQVPDSRVRAWSQQSCLRRDKIQYFGKVLQNSPLAVHKMQLNRAILTMILPCR